MVAKFEDRPPYVMFEVRGVEDREASQEAGHYVAKNVNFAIITPQGSKDRIERNADEWLAMLADQAAQDRFPVEWLRSFKTAYAEWKDGLEPTLNGTDIRNWPAASPAQVQMLLQSRLRTVEDLAAANEEAIGRLGMGGRALKSKAQEWLASAVDVGKQAEAVAALKAENADLKARNESLESQLKTLAQRLDNLESRRSPVKA